MKKGFILIVSLFMLTAAMQAQSLQKFFDKYADDERFQYVSVSKGIMNMASVFGGMAKNEKEVMSKMQGLKILTLVQNDDSALMTKVLSELNQIVEEGNFESAVEVREKGNRVRILFRVSGSDNADMLIITREKGEFSCIWIKGKMTKEEMMKVFSENSTGEFPYVG
jgi:HSP20 family molecular chaperone IbpA